MSRAILFCVLLNCKGRDELLILFVLVTDELSPNKFSMTTNPLTSQFCVSLTKNNINMVAIHLI